MSDTKRVFLALSLEKMLGPSFDQMYRKLKISADAKDLDVKWTPQRNLHLTLKFIGTAKQNKLDEIRGVVTDVAIHSQPVELKLRGLGGFPDLTQTRAFWLGVQNTLQLRKLHQDLDAALSDIGIASAAEEFTPHITLGRIRNKKNIEDFVSPFIRKDFGRLEVNTITLFESHLQGHFPVYIPIESFELKGKSL